MHPITIGGFAGTQDEDPARRTIAQVAREWADRGQDPRDHFDEIMQQLRQDAGMWLAARFHNGLLPRAEAEARAREAADRALRRVELAWEALRTATAWPAAHHRYIEAVHEAREAIGAWQLIAEEIQQLLASAGQFEQFGSDARQAYREYVTEAERLRLDPDAAKLALVELEETHTRRRAIAAETLTALGDPQKLV